eukprot:gnl/TRDRNA2_/TRDRNA2_152782_c0_seq1.p1 gnl/TRDRNA2_/TRDRNA2_152782_c0~~gnl/TRDRNA2_/TRDRNA2_152782_c0_seq1.p1  ORF type:complete len:168 (-),score=27.18 gnl/TRDRNA2_/TRDRNA2_152782_c0_seq1:112-615(-)
MIHFRPAGITVLVLAIAYAQEEASTAQEILIQGASDAAANYEDDVALLQVRMKADAEWSEKDQADGKELAQTGSQSKKDSQYPLPYGAAVPVAPYGPMPLPAPVGLRAVPWWSWPWGVISSWGMAFMTTGLGWLSAALGTGSGLSAIVGWTSGLLSVLFGIYDKYLR